MTIYNIKQSLLKNGVTNLKEFGYSDCTIDNIMTDEIYSAFFESMLLENKGHSIAIDTAIKELLQELNVVVKYE